MRRPLPSEKPDTRAESPSSRDARITFTASGPLGLRVRGRGAELSVFEDAKSMVFSVPLRGIKTGISMRDGIMHDLLGTRRFPTIELRVPRACIDIPEGKASVEGTAKGTLVLRGKAAPIDASYEIKRHSDTLNVIGAMRVPIDAWGIQLPRHMGFGLKSQVAVKVVFAVPAVAFT